MFSLKIKMILLTLVLALGLALPLGAQQTEGQATDKDAGQTEKKADKKFRTKADKKADEKADEKATAQAGEPAEKVYVELFTTSGNIILELDSAMAPMTVKNFVQYANDGHYSGTIFHRVIGNFMIQGGGMDAGLKEKPSRAPIKNEANNGLKNLQYTVAMARTNDPHSATAQFFISTVDNPNLDFRSEQSNEWGYTVFGKVIKGQNVVRTIAKVKTAQLGPHEGVPVKPIFIEKVVVLSGPPK